MDLYTASFARKKVWSSLLMMGVGCRSNYVGLGTILDDRVDWTRTMLMVRRKKF